jgi:tetratricopeptide (TPR) repeat protein
VWDAVTGGHVRDLDTVGGIATVAFSPDGRWLGAGAGAQFLMWEVGSWRERLRGSSESFAFSPDGDVVALGDGPGRLCLRSTETGKELVRLAGPDAELYAPVCFTPDGTRLVADCNSGRFLYVWDLRRLREECRELGLDWDAPPQSAPPRPAGDARPPLRVRVLGGELANLTRFRRYEWQRNALAVAADPFDAAANARLGDLLLDEGRDAEALGRLDLSLATRPDHLLTRLQRARAALRLELWQVALADFDVFLEARPGDPDARQLRGDAYSGLGRPREALADWDAILDWHPNDAELFLARAKAREALGQLAEAEKERQHGLELAKRTANALNNRAWALLTGAIGTRDPRHALRTIRLAVDAHPGDLGHRNTLALALYRTGEYREGLKEAERCIDARKGKGHVEDFFFQAMCQCRLGDVAAARASFAKALAWLEGNKTPTPEQLAEFDAFRAEVEDLLAASANPPAPGSDRKTLPREGALP